MISRTLAQLAQSQVLIPALACVGLLIFVCFFVGMLMWTSRGSNRSLYQSMSQLPLDEVKS